MPPELAQSFTVKAKTVEQREKFCCEGVPPEEIRISKDCRTIADVRFISHEVEKTVSDLISEGWPEAEVAKKSEVHKSELQSLMRNSYAIICLEKRINS